jgi:hypothetical protein
MDDTKSFSTTADVVTLPHLEHDNPPPTSNDSTNDVNYLMEHLNDPNFDLRARPPTLRSTGPVDKKHPYSHYSASETDAESHYASEERSHSRAESRSSAAIDFDEYVSLLSPSLPFLIPFHLANPLTLKSEQQSLVSMIRPCQ